MIHLSVEVQRRQRQAVQMNVMLPNSIVYLRIWKQAGRSFRESHGTCAGFFVGALEREQGARGLEAASVAMIRSHSFALGEVLTRAR